MLAASCAGCGHPAPISLAEVDTFVCPACGASSAMPEAIRDQLVRAQAVLDASDTRDRQISTSQSFALRMGLEKVVLAAWILLGTCGGVEALMTVSALGMRRSPTHVLAPAAGFLASLATALAIIGLMKLVRRRFEASYAADPPRSSGGDCSCHVCGAPLPGITLRSGGVARCRHCAADNLVDPELVRRMAASRGAILDNHARVVELHARGYGVAAMLIGFVLMALLPVVGLGTQLAIVALAESATETPAPTRPSAPERR